MSVAYRSTCRPTIGQSPSVDRPTYWSNVIRHIDRCSTDMSADVSRDTSRSTYRPTVDRYVDRHIGRHLPDISPDTTVDCRSICRPICRSRGAQNTHDPDFCHCQLFQLYRIPEVSGGSRIHRCQNFADEL